MPPDTRRRPWPASASASAAALATIWAAYSLNSGVAASANAIGLGRDHVVERAALQAGEHRLVDGLGQLGRAQDGAAPRTPEGLVGGEGHDVGAVLHRVRVHARRR